MEGRRRPRTAVPQQHRRAGSQGDQAPLRGHARAQILSDGCDHTGRYRVSASHPQTTVRRGARTPRPRAITEAALGPSAHMTTNAVEANLPSVHQNSRAGVLTEEICNEAAPLRRPWKMSDGSGLYLLIAPCGGRYWRYNYRFDGKQKTLALGIHPDVPLEAARSRHQAARQLLASGIDPGIHRHALAFRSWRPRLGQTPRGSP